MISNVKYDKNQLFSPLMFMSVVPAILMRKRRHYNRFRNSTSLVVDHILRFHVSFLS